MPTAKVIQDEIESHRGEIYKTDYKFFDVDKLVRFAGHMEREENDCGCSECSNLLSDMYDLSQRYHTLLNNGRQGRIEFEKHLSNYERHLRKDHGYTVKGNFKSVCPTYLSMVGLVIGAFAGQKLIGSGIGFVLGYIIGAIADSVESSKNKFL